MDQSKQSTRGDQAFGLVQLLVEGMHDTSERLIVERNSLFLDTASAVQIHGITGVIILETEIKNKAGRTNVLMEAIVAAAPDLRIPCSLFYSCRPTDLISDERLNQPGLWSIGQYGLPPSFSKPMALCDSVYSLELFQRDLHGLTHSIGSGRGFLVFERTGMGVRSAKAV